MSRSLVDLESETAFRAQSFLQECRHNKIDVLVTCTLRTFREQAGLYAIGRTKPGNPCSCGRKRNPIGTCAKHPLGLQVTNAGPGRSWHNWGRAIDVVPLRFGKPVWGTSGDGIDDDPSDDLTDDLELWQRVGMLGKSSGLEWAGDWKSFPEFPHFQYTGGLSLSALLAAHPHGI